MFMVFCSGCYAQGVKCGTSETEKGNKDGEGRQTYQKTRGADVMFCINKMYRKLDRMGGAGNRTFVHVLKFTEVLNFVKFDVKANDIK